MKRNYKKLLAYLASATILCNGLIVHAAESDAFSGWDESNREDAWEVYSMTDWNSMKEYLQMDNLKSKTDTVNLSFRVKLLKNTVKATLEKMDPSYGMYKNTSYTNMILAIIQALSDGKPDANDPCMIRTYINPRIPAEEMTVEKSIETMMKRISICEEISQGDVNIYSKDKVLLSVVQGCITLPEYTAKNKEYTIQNAQAYIDSNSQKLYGNPSADFAQKFSEHYSAVSVNQQYQGTGEASVGNKIAEEAQKYLGVPYVSAGNSLKTGVDCSGFTQQVFKKCGVSIKRQSTQQKNGGKDVGSINNALPGDLIGYNDPSHVAIYIGNGKMVHASSTHRKVKIENATYRKIQTIRRYW